MGKKDRRGLTTDGGSVGQILTGALDQAWLTQSVPSVCQIAPPAAFLSGTNSFGSTGTGRNSDNILDHTPYPQVSEG